MILPLQDRNGSTESVEVCLKMMYCLPHLPGLVNVNKKLWKDPPFSSWVNLLFQWPFSIAMSNYQRVNGMSIGKRMINQWILGVSIHLSDKPTWKIFGWRFPKMEVPPIIHL